MSASQPFRVLFFADAGPLVGGGHVMRCLTLARALSDRGAECAFVESRAAAPILRRFGWPAQFTTFSAAENVSELLRDAEKYADTFTADVVIVDHYGIGATDEQRLRLGVRRIVSIDDLADRRHDCNLLIDPTYGRRRDEYSGLIGATCPMLAGPGYALVRPDFADARPRALSRRAKHGPVLRALVSLGLTDVGGVTARVVETLLPLLADVRLDVALGAASPSLPRLTEIVARDRRVHLWVDAQEMASLMADADLAIGAGGSSVWERATVGLPSATVILAPNQRAMIGRMADAGITLALDADAASFDADLAGAWTTLANDRETRWRLTERTAGLCDGQGAERVAEAILSL